MTSDLDPHGQPYNLHFNRARRTERDVSELLGLAKGVLADGVVNDDEARYIRDWGNNHPDALQCWPLSLIFSRLRKFYIDGRIDEEERSELRELLSSLVGGTASIALGYEGACTLPLDVPPPLVCWGPDEVFVLTGRFAYGTRRDCAREIRERRSGIEENITRRTSFLIIGTFISRDWAHTSFGRKIERAVELRGAGFALRIIGEDHWVQSLDMTARES